MARSDAGYRQYGMAEVHTLRFIRRGRELGFSMAEIGELLELWQDRGRASADVKHIAQVHVADLDRRIAEMTSMKRSLEALVQCCQGNDRPDCPILEQLADAEATAPGQTGVSEKTVHDPRPAQGRGTQVSKASKSSTRGKPP